MDDNRKKLVVFAEIRERLLANLNTKLKDNPNLFGENVNLVEGFISQPTSMELSNSFIVGGPSLPMIAVVGVSGRLYFFALKALMPEIFD